VETSNSSIVFLKRTFAVVRRPLVGPVLWGLVVGGIPFGIFLCYLGFTETWAQQFFERLTPIAIVVAALGAVLSASRRPAHLLGRAFVTSLSACIPVPTITWLVILWRSGTEILDLRNLPLAIIGFVLWTVVVTVLGWLLALAVTFFKNRYSRAALPRP
jgi:hypothetical protein